MVEAKTDSSDSRLNDDGIIRASAVVEVAAAVVCMGMETSIVLLQ